MTTAALLACTLLNPWAPPQDPDTNLDKLALYKKIRSCTVKVYADMGNDERYHGTGVAIKRWGDFVVVVTNAHVVGHKEVAPTVTVKPWRAGAPVILPAYVMLTNLIEGEYHDVAFLVVRDPQRLVTVAEVAASSREYVRISDSDPALTVYACGNPRDEEFLVDDGKTLVLDEAFYARGLILHDALIEQGNSGGGLFNGKGELVGINTWLYKEKIGIAFRASNFTGVYRLEHFVASATVGGWQDTGITCSKNKLGEVLVRALAVGKWKPWSDFDAGNAAGFSGDYPRPYPEYFTGALLMQVGSAFKPFWGVHLKPGGGDFTYDDARHATITSSEGKVSLRINDSETANNSGSLDVFFVLIDMHS